MKDQTNDNQATAEGFLREVYKIIDFANFKCNGISCLELMDAFAKDYHARRLHEAGEDLDGFKAALTNADSVVCSFTQASTIIAKLKEENRRQWNATQELMKSIQTYASENKNLLQANARKDDKIERLEETIAQLKENNHMLAVTKDREIEALKGEVIGTIYVPSEDVAIGFAEWILSNEFIKQADGKDQWWGKRNTEGHYTTRELLSLYNESKTNEEKK